MNVHRIAVVLWLASVLSPAAARAEPTRPTPATGASVDESRVTKTLLVDPGSGDAADDDKHGTPDAPFATLRYACLAAARAKDAGVGVKLVLASGTYRETAEIPAPPHGQADTDAPLVIEAAERDQAIIDGADTEGRTPSTWKIENNHWTHPWPFVRAKATVHKPGFEPTANAAYRSGDMVSVNGTPLRQVNSEAELAPGCFWGSVTRSGPGRGREAFNARVIVQPPEDTPLEGAVIQVSTRAGGIKIDQRRNVVVRGVMCQHAANPAGAGSGSDAAGVSLTGCSNVLLEDVLSQWNDGMGLAASKCAGLTLRRVRLLHNGGIGLMAEAGENLFSEDCEVSFNHFRGEWAGGLEAGNVFAIAGSNLRGATWLRLHVLGNTCRGLEANGAQDVTIEDAVLQDNVAGGILVYNCWRLGLRRCVVTGTKAEKGHAPPPAVPDASSPAGVILVSCADAILESNVIAGNAAGQLLALDAESCPLRSARHTYRHNVVGGLDAGQNLCALVEGGIHRLDAVYHRTLDSDENAFWNPASAEVFAAFDPSSNAGHNRPMTLDKWREFLAARANAVSASAGAPPGQPEAHSLWQDPRFADPSEGNYRLKATGPMEDWDLPSDEATAAP